MKCWPNLREISPPNRPQPGSVAVEEDCTEIKSNEISWILLTHPCFSRLPVLQKPALHLSCNNCEQV